MLRLRRMPRGAVPADLKPGAVNYVVPGGVIDVMFVPDRRPKVDHSAKLLAQLQQLGLRGWVREHRFHDTRQWRVDLANVDAKLAVEIEGFGKRGTPGRHQRAKGFADDCEKYAELAIAGWRLIRCTGRQVKSGEASRWIERALQDVR